MSYRLPLHLVTAVASLEVACADYDSYGTRADLNPAREAGTKPEASTADSRAPDDAPEASADGRAHDVAPDASLTDAGGETGPDARADAGGEAGADAMDAFDAPAPAVPMPIAFDTPTDLDLFDYILPEPNTNGPAVWAWVPGDNPHLVQVKNTFAGSGALALGPTAIYKPRLLSDGFVSVRLWSSDDDSGGLLLRYQDETRFYLFLVNEQTWAIYVANVTEMTQLACGGICVAPFPNTPYSLFHDDGHELKFSASGPNLEAYIDNVLVGSATDTTYSTGKVGLYCRALADAHFDDFHVEGTP